MLKNIKDSLEISYKQELESDDIIYIKGQIKDWKEMLSNIKHEQELKDNALKMYDEGQQEIERLNNIIKRLEEFIEKEIQLYTVELTEENKNKLSIVAPIKGVYKEIYNVLQELKGIDE